MKLISLCTLLLMTPLAPVYAFSGTPFFLDRSTNEATAPLHAIVQLASNSPTVYGPSMISTNLANAGHPSENTPGLSPHKPALASKTSVIYWLSIFREPTSMFLLGTVFLLIAGVFRRMGETPRDKPTSSVVHQQQVKI